MCVRYDSATFFFPPAEGARLTCETTHAARWLSASPEGSGGGGDGGGGDSSSPTKTDDDDEEVEEEEEEDDDDENDDENDEDTSESSKEDDDGAGLRYKYRTCSSQLKARVCTIHARESSGA